MGSSPNRASQRAPIREQHHSLVLQQQHNLDGCWATFRYAGKEWDTRGGEETAEHHVYYVCKIKTTWKLVPTMYMLIYTENPFESWRCGWEHFVEKLPLPLLLDSGRCVRHQKSCGWCWCELTDNKSCSVWWRTKESCKGNRTLTAHGRSYVLYWVCVGTAPRNHILFWKQYFIQEAMQIHGFFSEKNLKLFLRNSLQNGEWLHIWHIACCVV